MEKTNFCLNCQVAVFVESGFGPGTESFGGVRNKCIQTRLDDLMSFVMLSEPGRIFRMETSLGPGEACELGALFVPVGLSIVLNSTLQATGKGCK